MKRARLILLLALITLAVVIAIAASPPVARSQSGIIVEGAKQVRTEQASYGGIPGGVPLRIVLDNAQTMRQERVMLPPDALRNLFAAVPLRLVLESAETMRNTPVTPPPAELRTRLSQVALRVVLESAQIARRETLLYPVAFFNDKTAPVIRDIRVRPDAGGLRVLWDTNEFSTSEVRYGTSPGAYGSPVTDRFYVKQHGVLLPGTTPGQTYYLLVSSVDRSGNRVDSGETQATAQGKTYLPMLER